MNQPWPIYLLLAFLIFFAWQGIIEGVILANVSMTLIYASRIYDKICCDKREGDE